MAVVIAVAVVGVVAWNVVPHSTSKSPDEVYLATVQPQFPTVPAADLRSLGHTVCLTFDRHPSDPAAAEYAIASAALAHHDLPPASMLSLVRAAIHSYCPRYTYLTDKWRDPSSNN